MGFIFGGDGKLSYEDLIRQRELAEQLIVDSQSRTPQSIPDGIAAIGKALIGRLDANSASRRLKEGSDKAESVFNDLGATGYPNAAQSPFSMGSTSDESQSQSASNNQSVNPDIDALIRQAAARYGVDPSPLMRTVQIESGGNPNAKNPHSSAGGLLQFTDATAKQYRLQNRYDPAQAIDAGARLMRDNANILQRSLGRTPYGSEIYLSHQQGAGGAAKLLRNPNARAADIVGLDAVRLNGGNPSMTAGEFTSKWVRKYNGGGNSHRIQVASLDPSIGVSEATRQASSPSSLESIPASFESSASMFQPALPGSQRDPLALSSPQQLVRPTVAAQPQQRKMINPYAGVDPRLLQIISNPYSSQSIKQMAQTMIEAQMKANAPLDPLKQVQIEKEQIELESMKHPQKKYSFMNGKDGTIYRTDNAGNFTQVRAGSVEQPTEVREYEYAIKQGYQGSFADWQLQQRRAGASQVNIDQKSEGAFETELAKKQATSFGEMATSGLEAKSDIAMVGELEGLLKNQGGAFSGLAGWAARSGIPLTKDAGDLQAAKALIDKLVPSQRQPGSGTMSDRDIELFKGSLPSLWNTPQGNQKILNVMRGLANYKQAQGDIAYRVMGGEIDRKTAVKLLRELPNPLEEFRSSKRSSERAPISKEPPKTLRSVGQDPGGWVPIGNSGAKIWVQK